MFIQGIDDVYQLDWDGVPNDEGGKCYGDIFHRAEVEFSRWNFEVADTDFLLSISRIARLNARHCLLRSLPCPLMTIV
jgi:glycyl-tRNA synthetase alpha chain